MADENEHDLVDLVRQVMLAAGQPERDLAEAKERWTTEEVQRDFEVHSFLAPFVIVTRRSDGMKGSLEFTHHPRFYFNFVPHTKEEF
jgi:hypothetical protein